MLKKIRRTGAIALAISMGLGLSLDITMHPAQVYAASNSALTRSPIQRHKYHFKSATTPGDVPLYAVTAREGTTFEQGKTFKLVLSNSKWGFDEMLQDSKWITALGTVSNNTFKPSRTNGSLLIHNSMNQNGGMNYKMEILSDKEAVVTVLETAANGRIIIPMMTELFYEATAIVSLQDGGEMFSESSLTFAQPSLHNSYLQVNEVVTFGKTALLDEIVVLEGAPGVLHSRNKKVITLRAPAGFFWEDYDSQDEKSPVMVSSVGWDTDFDFEIESVRYRDTGVICREELLISLKDFDETTCDVGAIVIRNLKLSAVKAPEAESDIDIVVSGIGMSSHSIVAAHYVPDANDDPRPPSRVDAMRSEMAARFTTLNALDIELISQEVEPEPPAIDIEEETLKQPEEEEIEVVEVESAETIVDDAQTDDQEQDEPIEPLMDFPVVEITVGSNELYLDGLPVLTDAVPMMYDDHMMVPLLHIAVVLGIPLDNILINSELGTITIRQDGRRAVLTIDSDTMDIGGRSIDINPPLIVNDDLIYIPLRVFAENILGVPVHWEPSTKTMTLNKH